MKKKSKKASGRKKKEFRFYSVELIDERGRRFKKRHPSFIFLEKGNVYVHVTITHSNKIEGYVLIKLKRNPNPNDPRDSYYINDIRFDTKDNFGSRLKGWEIDDENDRDIRDEYDKIR